MTDSVHASYSLGPRAVTGTMQMKVLTGRFGTAAQFYMAPAQVLPAQTRLLVCGSTWLQVGGMKNW